MIALSPAERALFPAEVLEELRVEEGGVLTALTPGDGPAPRRFEGLYGGAYDPVISSPRLRRAAFGLWGGAQPLRRLDAVVDAAVRGVEARGGAAVVIDVAS